MERDLDITDALILWLYFINTRDWEMSEGQKQIYEQAIAKINNRTQVILARYSIDAGSTPD